MRQFSLCIKKDKDDITRIKLGFKEYTESEVECCGWLREE